MASFNYDTDFPVLSRPIDSSSIRFVLDKPVPKAASMLYSVRNKEGQHVEASKPKLDGKESSRLSFIHPLHARGKKQQVNRVRVKSGANQSDNRKCLSMNIGDHSALSRKS